MQMCKLNQTQPKIGVACSSHPSPHSYLRQSLPIIKAAENYFDLLKTALHEASLKDTVQSEKAISAKQLHSPRALADQRNGVGAPHSGGLLSCFDAS